MATGSEEEFFEISAVSRLTGLSTDVLRVWERRYGVVEPDRSDSQRRKYHKDDIRRLTLLKSLVDHGDRISAIAKLDIERLEQRLDEVLNRQSNRSSPEDPCRLGLVALQSKKAVHEAVEAAPGLSIIVETPGLDDLVECTRPGNIDVLIVEMGNLFPEKIEALQKAIETLRVRRAIVIYQFASDEVIAPGAVEKITPLKAPVRASDILLACSSDIRVAPKEKRPAATPPDIESPVPGRMFTGEQLAALGDIARVVKCECPRHLAQLLESLNAFEDYSRECENRNEADAELHRFLHHATARCRREMEETLVHLLDAEGIDV